MVNRILMVITTIAMLYIFQLFRRDIRNIAVRLSEIGLTASDFAVLIDEIP